MLRADRPAFCLPAGRPGGSIHACVRPLLCSGPAVRPTRGVQRGFSCPAWAAEGRQMMPRLALAAVAAAFCVALPSGGGDTPSRPTGHAQKDVEGWTVHVDDRLLCGPDADLGKRAVQLLAARLADVKLAVPADKVARLQKVPIWLDRTH